MQALFTQKRNAHRFRSFSRRSRLEVLESRWVLSAPSVADVNICSTDWAPDFIDYLETENLGTGGYSIPVGSSAQLDELSWNNIDQVKITFSEDVDVQMGDLSISGVNTMAYTFDDFSYDSNTYTATWTLSNAIGKDKLLIDLDGDGLDPVEDYLGNDLDGEWTTSSSTYNSGDSTPGGDFEFRFNVLPGDVNASSSVNIFDLILANLKKNKDTSDAGYVAQYDIDGDGTITTSDCNVISGSIGDTLPAGNPVGISDDAPTTANISNFMVERNAVDEVISLWNAFDDAEDDDDDITYSVAGNSNSAIFDAVSINDLTGQLTFDFADNVSGSSTVTIRAMDSSGLIVDTVFTVTVNDPPVISNFSGSDQGEDRWTFSGTVSDVDDVIEGMVVTLGGILASYNITATVQSDGTFSVTDTFVGLTSGEATAQTEDDDSAESNVAVFTVMIS
ncbi:MAG: hypothetical protein JXM70_02120 [Pirellulales bacterium]|nr:hypothetical protein [Pirellulales bacterium]